MNSKQFTESTTSGAIASVSQPLSSVNRREYIGKGIYPNQKNSSLFTGKKSKKKFPNSVKETKEYIKPEITWDSLDEGLSVKDKITIIEEYALTGSLTESIEQDTKDYFLSLASMSDDPVKNKEYIMVPLALLSNGVRILNEPSVMEFIRYDNDGMGMIFKYEGIEKTYPSKTIREKSVFYTFTFATKESYDKFRMIMILKFDTKLPEVCNHIKENTGNTNMKKEQKRSIGEAAFTSAASMHAATRKRNPQKADPKHSIKVGDRVDTTDGKSGKVSFVDGETVHVLGTNPYLPNDKVKHYNSSELKKKVLESEKLKGTPVVSLKDFDNEKDYTKDRYGRTVSKKMEKDDPRTYFIDKDGNKIKEAKLDEEDVIIVPGQGNRIKPGFIPKNKDRTDHEVEMALSDLFQSAKNAKQVYELIKDIPETVGLDGWVQAKITKAADYLNTVREYLEHKQHDETNVLEINDYFRRRQREEDIISGKKPARKRAPAQTSDYAKRREKEKKAEQSMAEGSMPYPHGKPEAGDKITWYHSNHFPEIEGTVVGWKDGHLIVQSIDPIPRNTEKTIAKYRVPKNNILSVDKQGVAEGNFKSGKSARERFEKNYKKIAGHSLDDTRNYFKQQAADAEKRRQEYIKLGWIPKDSTEKDSKEELDENLAGRVAGATLLLAALWGWGQKDAEKVYANSPQLQQLVQHLDTATKNEDEAAIKELTKRIENHKTRLSLGKGEVMGKDGKPIVPAYNSPKQESSIIKGLNEVKKMKSKDPCWKGYEMIGKKKKGKKEVPNCVPKKK
jgi:hypothetical protein